MLGPRWTANKVEFINSLELYLLDTKLSQLGCEGSQVRKQLWTQRDLEILFYLSQHDAVSEGQIRRGISFATGEPFSAAQVHYALGRLRDRELVSDTVLTDQGRGEYARQLGFFLKNTQYPTDTIWDAERDSFITGRFGSSVGLLLDRGLITTSGKTQPRPPPDPPYRGQVRRAETRLLLILLEPHKKRMANLKKKPEDQWTEQDRRDYQFCHKLLRRAVGRLRLSWAVERKLTFVQKENMEFLSSLLKKSLASNPRIGSAKTNSPFLQAPLSDIDRDTLRKRFRVRPIQSSDSVILFGAEGCRESQRSSPS